MKKIVLMHGKDTNPNDKWYPWFGDEVEKIGYEYVAPALPGSSDPVMNEWKAELDRASVDSETVLVGHSRGGVAVLRWLEDQPAGLKVRRVVLAATNSGLLADRHIVAETNHGFYTKEGYDFKKIKSHCDEFIVLHSRDDEWVPFEAGVKNAEGLDAEFITFDDKGHFGKLTPEVPEVLEACIK